MQQYANACSNVVIGPAAENLHCAVELLEEEETAKFVRERHVAQTQHAVGRLAHRIIEPIRPAKDHSHTLSAVSKLLQCLRELRGCAPFPALIEQPHHTTEALYCFERTGRFLITLTLWSDRCARGEFAHAEMHGPL
jgi:hypothetical protein